MWSKMVEYSSMEKHPVSVIIPVYKNYGMFLKRLRLNKKFLEGCEIIVMNDDPYEDITDRVFAIIPDATVVNNKRNLGFAGNVNKGVEYAKREYLFLVNSDVVLRDNSFLKSLDLIRKDRKLFAVGLGQIEKDGRVVGSNLGYFDKGFVNHSYRPVKHGVQHYRNFWAEGGAAIFRKSIFKELGMFDELYNPFYWEDIDLSYRAWKSGYAVEFMAGSVVEHQHESTIGKYFDKLKIDRTAFRNQLIFHWVNLTDRDMLTSHFLTLMRMLGTSLIKNNTVFLSGFFQAVSAIPRIAASRKKAQKHFILSDREVLGMFGEIK